MYSGQTVAAHKKGFLQPEAALPVQGPFSDSPAPRPSLKSCKSSHLIGFSWEGIDKAHEHGINLFYKVQLKVLHSWSKTGIFGHW